jgi:hypothetical protein
MALNQTWPGPVTGPNYHYHSGDNDMTINELYRKIQTIEGERNAKRGRARVRMINQVRTDSLESKIAHLESVGDYSGATAIRWVAREIGAPIDESLINLQVQVRKSY